MVTVVSRPRVPRCFGRGKGSVILLILRALLLCSAFCILFFLRLKAKTPLVYIRAVAVTSCLPLRPSMVTFRGPRLVSSLYPVPVTVRLEFKWLTRVALMPATIVILGRVTRASRVTLFGLCTFTLTMLKVRRGCSLSRAPGMLTLPPQPVRAPSMDFRAFRVVVTSLPAAAPLMDLATVITPVGRRTCYYRFRCRQVVRALVMGR